MFSKALIVACLVLMTVVVPAAEAEPVPLSKPCYRDGTITWVPFGQACPVGLGSVPAEAPDLLP